MSAIWALGEFISHRFMAFGPVRFGLMGTFGCGFSHGDMLFLSYEAQDATPAVTEESALPAQPTIAHTLSGETIPVPANTAKTGTVETASIASLLPIPNLSHIKEDPVDEYWRNQDGKIQRKRDEKFCRHGAKGMCDYCMPLEVSADGLD
jgi:nuclear protein localization family protein 4